MTVIEHPTTKTRTLTFEEEQVERGAAWLDKRRPGWEDELDIANFNVLDSCQCVISQLYPNEPYHNACDTLGLNNDDQRHLGFRARSDDGDYRPAYERLTESWRDEVVRRRMQ